MDLTNPLNPLSPVSPLNPLSPTNPNSLLYTSTGSSNTSGCPQKEVTLEELGTVLSVFGVGILIMAGIVALGVKVMDRYL